MNSRAQGDDANLPCGDAPSTSSQEEKTDIVSIFGNEDEPRVLVAINIGCAVLFSVLVTGTGLILAILKGYPSWVLQQVFVYLLAMGWFPFLARIPVVSHFHEMVNGLAQFYRKNPAFLEPAMGIMRLTPVLNLLFMPLEWLVMIRFLIIGVPVDIVLEALSEYVLEIPKWGMAAEYGFAANLLFQVLFSLLFTPYLVMLILVVRAFRKPTTRPSEPCSND